MSKFDPVELWLSNVAYSHSKSEETRNSYRRCLKEFCAFIGCTPKQILAEYEASTDRKFKRKYAQLLKAYIANLMNKDYTVGSVTTMSSAVKSFFKYSDLPLGYVFLAQGKVVYHNRDITKDEILHVLRISVPRDRAAFCTLAQSGLRPDTLRKLKLKHIQPEFSKGIIPCSIMVPEELTKGKFGAYFSFMAEESVKYLKAYLDKRTSKVGPEDYLFTSKGSDKQLDSRALTKVFRRTLEKLKSKGIIDFEQPQPGKPGELRLYALRKYFRKYANTGEASIEYVNFWMGHKTNYRAPHIPASDEHYFNREDVEFHRRLYREYSMPHLRLETSTPSETEKAIIELRKQLTDRDREIAKLNQKIEELGGVKRLAEVLERSKSLEEAFVRFKRLKDKEFETS